MHTQYVMVAGILLDNICYGQTGTTVIMCQSKVTYFVSKQKCPMSITQYEIRLGGIIGKVTCV